MSAISKYLFARKDLLETTICLSNIATLKNGYAFQSGKYNALGKWKILTITNVPGERYINDEDCNCIINLPNDIQDHQVLKEGDILISRSGTIGKVTYATKNLAENYIVSDDLVRIRVKDDNLRAYLLAYFTSSTALSLMLLDEYGSVQQHLQPRHIQEMLIPVPDDWSQAKDMIDAGKTFMKAMEDMAEADQKIRTKGFDVLMKIQNIE